MKQIFGTKVGCTRYFLESGESVPVTVLEMEPNVVCQVKTAENDGYAAVQVGFGAQKPQRLNRAETGHFGKSGKGVFRYLREIRLDDHGQEGKNEYKPGDEIVIEGMFEAGAKIDVVGTSIGKGFAGVMKRHHMKGFPMTRGTHEYRRHGGSIGNRKFPGRTFPNKRMGGHMGVERVLQHGLQVVAVKENLLLVKGAVPGPKNGVVLVRTAIKQKKRSNKAEA